MAKLAVVTAYRDLTNRHSWNYYKRRTHIVTEDNYSTGTVAYDHTGGTYERELTLSDGTWPTNAARGIVVIDHKHYRVDERKSGTVVTLDADTNPGADVTAGTSYEWYRDAYTLPVNFRRMLSIIESTSGGDVAPLTFIEPGGHLYTTRFEGGSSTDYPEWYTIRNEGDYLGAMSIVFGCAPNESRTYDMMYEISPRELRTYKESTGTITIAAGSTSVTGSGTAFSSFHEGSIIRFTDSTTEEPTSIIGGVDGTDNPYEVQRSILTVTNATGLTVDSQASATATLTSTKFTISDPMDVEPIVMRTPLEMLCLFHFARMTKRKDAGLFERDFERAMNFAMEQDRRVGIVETAMEDYSASTVWGDVDVTPE